MDSEYGLVVFKNHKYVTLPLDEVIINATILKDICCEVSVTQKFRVEQFGLCRYRFPLPSTAAIHTFQAHLVNEGRTITGLVKETEQARQEYQTATAQGMNAYLMERTMADVFTVTIGNLTAGEEVEITLKYVSELDIVDDKINWTLPVALAPRFGAEYEAEYVDYPISLTLDCWCSTEIVEINCNKDVFTSFLDPHLESPQEILELLQNRTVVDPNDPCHHTLTVDIVQGLNADLNFMITPESIPEVTAVLERSLEYNTETLRITVQKNAAQMWNETEGSESDNVEIYFLLDTSGSMQGERIKSLKESMELFLRSLPENSRYQLIEFNSRFTSCFREGAVNNSQEALTRASQWCNNLHASGGTNILAALSSVYNMPCHTATNSREYKKCIILLTDGDVRNTDACVNLVHQNTEKFRVFTLGVGAQFSEGLCRGLADAGCGLFRSARQTEEIAGSCIAILQATFASTIINHTVGLGAWDDGQIQQRYPEKVVFFPGKKINLYFVKNIALEGGNELPAVEDFTVDINVSFSSAPQEFKSVAVIPVSINPMEGHQDITVSTHKIIHQLMAKTRIMELEKQDNNTAKPACIEIGERYNLVSKFTSFVAVNYREGIQTDIFVTTPPQPKPKLEFRACAGGRRSALPRSTRSSSRSTKSRASGSRFQLCSASVGLVPKVACGIQPMIETRRSSLASLAAAAPGSMQMRKKSGRSQNTWNSFMPMANTGKRSRSARQSDIPRRRSNLPRRSIRSRTGRSRTEKFEASILTSTTKNTELNYSQLIRAQNFNGSFDFSLAMAQVNGIKEMQQEFGLDDIVVKTLVAIWIFMHQFANKQHEWVLIVNKAKTFVFNHSTVQDTTLDQCLAKLTSSITTSSSEVKV